jgi:hypothetical protein
MSYIPLPLVAQRLAGALLVEGRHHRASISPTEVAMFVLRSLVLVAFFSLALHQTASAADHPNLKGDWVAHVTDGGKMIGPAKIQQKDDTPTFFNGLEQAAGKFVSKDKVEVSDWKVTGTISDNGKRIDWSNGTYWKKK